MHTFKSVAAAAAIGCAMIGGASAMPAEHLSTPAAVSVEKAAWVCGPYRCWWRPGPRYYGYYGRPYGYYGRPYWRRGYRW
jgi:hypothetical protein